MVFWIKKEEDGTNVRRVDNNWSHSIYVASDDKQELASLPFRKDIRVSSFIKRHRIVQKYERITDGHPSDVLKLTLSDSAMAQALAKQIMLHGRFGQFRLYNVDVMPAQSYFYEHGIFPLALCETKVSSINSSMDALSWLCNDDVWALDYRLPEFKSVHLSIKTRKRYD